MRMSNDRCDFCDELSGGKDNAFTRIYGPDQKSRILFRSQNFVVVPSLGQLVEGHLLLVPVSHYTALADMQSRSIREASELCARARETLFKVYGWPCVIFEHGVRGNQSGGCGIDHAHMHAVPFTGLREPIDELKRTHSLKSIDGIAEIHKEVSPTSPYLYYEETNGQAWTCETAFIPSQYLRKLLAESLGINSWDWRECGKEQALITSFERLSESFNQEPTSSEDSVFSRSAKAALGV